MSNELEIEITDVGNVRLKLIKRNYRGAIIKRQSFTVSNRQFERALKDAKITVPWERVMGL